MCCSEIFTTENKYHQLIQASHQQPTAAGKSCGQFPATKAASVIRGTCQGHHGHGYTSEKSQIELEEDINGRPVQDV